MSPATTQQRPAPPRQQAATAQEAPMDEEREYELTGYARYRHLRADVPRRRGGYKLFIFLAIVVFAVTLADMVFLESMLMVGLLAAYAVLFLIGLFLLFSRRVPEEEAEAAEAGIKKAYLQCPDCKNVFQYGQLHMDERKHSAFSCPVCGAYSALPDATVEPTKAALPEGELKELTYACDNCGEEVQVGTFGEQPIHDVRFRTCPNCEQKGTLRRKAINWPSQGAGGWEQA